MRSLYRQRERVVHLPRGEARLHRRDDRRHRQAHPPQDRDGADAARPPAELPREPTRLASSTSVVPDGHHVDEALEWAAELAGHSPLVLRTLKRFVTEQVLPQGPSELMALAHRDLQAVETSDDYKEGRSAWLEKRPPRFEG